MRKILKGKILPLTVLGTLFFAQSAMVQADTWHGGWHDGWGRGWGHMFSGSIMMLFVWGSLIILIVFGTRWMGGGAGRGGNDPVPENRGLDILAERLSRGEIDKDEFEERKRLLSK